MTLSTQITDNLKQRNLQLERYDFPVVDESENVLTLISWTLAGNMAGYIQYRPDRSKDRKNDEGRGRYYIRYGEGFYVPWGLETYTYRPDILCLTEGLFDASRLHNRGIPAVAVFTSNPKPLRPWLYTIPRKLIAIRDNDDACKLQNFADYSITPFSKDLGEASENELDTIIRRILEL